MSDNSRTSNKFSSEYRIWVSPLWSIHSTYLFVFAAFWIQHLRLQDTFIMFLNSAMQMLSSYIVVACLGVQYVRDFESNRLLKMCEGFLSLDW